MIENRTIFEYTIFTLIHTVVIGAITVVGFHLYGKHLGIWVAASATVAGLAYCYMFVREIPGETLMKVILGIVVAANAGYMAHNGAKKIGIDDYNGKQLEKYEKGMALAGRATSKWMARELRLGAVNASKMETIFSDGSRAAAAMLAFAELGIALVIFGIASRRLKARRFTTVQDLAGQIPQSSNVAPLVGKVGRP